MQKLIRHRVRPASRLIVAGLVGTVVSAATVWSQAPALLDGRIQIVGLKPML